MFRVLASLAMAVTINGAQSAAHSTSDVDLAVTIQIHDYANVPRASLSRASDIVTRVYATIGVQTVWYDAVRFPIRRAAGGTKPAHEGPIAQLTINVLTPQMAAHGRFRPDALGVAAGSPEGMGRIAYVMYDRVHRVATDAGTSEVDLLGFVLAHEVGHLLGLAEDESLAKCHWDRSEVQQMTARNLEIPPLQARRIRSTIEQASASLPPAAADAATRAARRR